jgi:hypothetical protein
MRIPILLLLPLTALLSQDRPDFGSLEVTSDPAGQIVHVNGVEFGRTPVSVDSVPAGRCLIQIADPKFEPWWVEGRIKPDVINRFHAVLIPITGSIQIDSDEDTLEVFIDGRFAGMGPGLFSKIPPGKHELIVRTLRNVKSQPVLFEVEDPELQNFTFIMKNAWVQVESRPKAAEVRFSDAGPFLTPTIPIPLKPGKTRMVVSSKGYFRETMPLDLDPSDTLRLSFDLKPVARRQAIMRSLIFPGRGQMLLGDRFWGTLFIGAECILGVSAIYSDIQMSRYADKFDYSRKKYLNAISLDDVIRWKGRMKGDYETLEGHERRRNASLSSAAGIWVLSLIHVTWHPVFLRRNVSLGAAGLEKASPGAAAGVRVCIDF